MFFAADRAVNINVALADSYAVPLSLLTIAGAHLFSESHTAATLVRMRQSRATSASLSNYFQWTSWCCLALAIAGMSNAALLPIYAKIYMIWIVQHFVGQSYGIALIYCYKRNYLMNAVERRIFKACFDLTATVAIARQFTYSDWGSDVFLGLQLPFWGPLPELVFRCAEAALALCVLSMFVVVFSKLAREHQALPLPAALLTVTGIAIFMLPKAQASALWLYVPAFYHGCQYLVVSTSFYLKEKGLPENVDFNQISSLLLRSDALGYLCGLVVIGVFVYVGVPRVLSQFGIDFKVAFITVFTVINFHHFLLDAAIWRLRNPHIRKILAA